MTKAPWMNIIWRSFTVAKAGNASEENEDAFWPLWKTKSIQKRRAFRCAMSDGATQTSFSRKWAQLLAEGVAKNSGGHLQQAVAFAQQKWQTEINQIKIPWHAEEKVRQGAFASLLRFEIWLTKKSASPRWRAFAIGDSCLFQVRQGDLIMAYPLSQPEDFNNHPTILSSRPQKNLAIWQSSQIHPIQAGWQSEDEFFLMTDALALWALSQNSWDEPGSFFKELIEERAEQEHFEQWIQVLREQGAIKNDDTTLVWLKPHLET